MTDPAKSPLQRLVGRGSVFAIGSAAHLAAAAIVLPIITRLLPPGQYGNVAIAVTVSQVLGILVGLGIPSATTRLMFGAGDHGTDASRLVGVTAVVAGFGAFVADVSGPQWTQIFGAVDYDPALRIAVWTAVPSSVLTAILSVLRAQQRPRAFVAASLVSAVGGQLLGIAAVGVFGPTPAPYLGGILVGTVGGAFVGALLARVPLAGRSVRPLLGRALSMGLSTVPHGLAIFLLGAGDRVIVERFMGLEAVGQYQVAYVVGGLGFLGLTAINYAWAPLVFGADDSVRWSVLADTSAAVVRLVSIGVAGIALGAPLVLAFVAPISYSPTSLGPVAAIVAFAAIPHAVYLSNVHVVFQTMRTGVLALAAPIAASANLAINVALVPALGLVGAALSTVFGYTLLAVILAMRARRLADVSWRVRDSLLPVGAAAIAVILGVVLPADLPGLLIRLVGAAIAMVALLFTLWRLYRGSAR